MAPPLPAPPVTALLCFTACPDLATAQRIADALVDEHLAACVSVLPGMRSTYRWQGAIEHADEVLLLAKTVPVRLPALKARIVALHPYELPELLAVQADGPPAYLQWLARETAPASP